MLEGVQNPGDNAEEFKRQNPGKRNGVIYFLQESS
jgi:hypothetical protein